MKTSKKNVNKLKYNPSEIELKWQAKWQSERVYQPDLDTAKSSSGSAKVSDKAKKQDKNSQNQDKKTASNSHGAGQPFYNLMMFPYPSAEGLHVGSMYAFGGADVYARFKRLQGYQVFEPIGLDGFGIHSENHAIKTNTHPIEHAKRTEENFYRQLHATGNSYAWENKVETYDPEYYRWTQWLFVQLFNANLAYKKKSPVNFCPSCKTVLSDEQVIDGKCERCNSVVEKKELEQWFFKITQFAERLLGNIETLDWTEKVKIAQRNWIGKKSGSEICWEIVDKNGKKLDGEIITFTTRRDTIPGVTFLVLAPESQYVQKVTSSEQKSAVDKYIAQTADAITREKADRKKTGVFTGSYAKNPFTGKVVPIYVADYVLGGYGTGAVMGMPGHDLRDREFAKVFDLPTILTTALPKGFNEDDVYTGKGKQINSGKPYDGLPNTEAGEKIFAILLKEKKAFESTQYHLRDWLISRQRYWGPPIPMIYCEACAMKDPTAENAGWHPVPEKDLPVKLPNIENFKPLGTGKAPLANHPEFYETTCPKCGSKATRETDVSDTFLDSAWYFLRYLATDWKEVPFPSKKFASIDPKYAKRTNWLPVTTYIGGAEHSVLHLLYARFVTMALHDMGYLEFEEPFTKFYAHGLIIKDGAKMSKSKGNVINPDDYIAKYGADTLRTYLLFLGPFNQGGDFRDSGIDGMSRFVKRVWKLYETHLPGTDTTMNKEALKMMHETIKGVTEDMEHLRYNTAIAKMMIWYNFLAKQASVSREELENYLKLFAPFMPHLTEELWDRMDNSFSIHQSKWPSYNERHLTQETLTIAIQVNGKLRGTITIPAGEKHNQELVEKMAHDTDSVEKFLQGSMKHVIYIPGKIINFVVS